MNHSFRPRVEALEARDLPAVFFSNGVVLTLADGRGEHKVSQDTDPADGSFDVTLDGVTSSFAAGTVRAASVVAGKGASVVAQNNTLVPTTFVGGQGRDTFFTGPGTGDVVTPGGGEDVVYSLLGTHTIVTAGGGFDRVFSNPRNSVLSGPEDRVVTFFADGRVPGSGRVELVNGTVFITPPNGGSQTNISQSAGVVTVSTSFAGDLRFRAGSVNQIAYFGGSGADVYRNDTRIDEAAYGAGGNDTLVSGRGDFALLKGSGGDDTLFGRARRNDLSANGGLNTLVFLDGQGDNVARVNAADALFGLAGGDLVLSA